MYWSPISSVTFLWPPPPPSVAVNWQWTFFNPTLYSVGDDRFSLRSPWKPDGPPNIPPPPRFPSPTPAATQTATHSIPDEVSGLWFINSSGLPTAVLPSARFYAEPFLGFLLLFLSLSGLVEMRLAITFAKSCQKTNKQLNAQPWRGARNPNDVPWMPLKTSSQTRAQCSCSPIDVARAILRSIPSFIMFLPSESRFINHFGTEQISWNIPLLVSNEQHCIILRSPALMTLFMRLIN